MAIPELLEEVAGYYSARLAEYGDTARGADWNSEEGQRLRFGQLLHVIEAPRGFSLNDLGCGYGALLDELDARYREFRYEGCDISVDMVLQAQKRYPNRPEVRFKSGGVPSEISDYGVASGIFNVRFGRSDTEWREYLEETIDILHRTSRVGFAFNCLTSYSDPERMRANLYYADPLQIFDLCKRRFSRHVALLHDYGLFEFTIIVRKRP